jgi:serine/threonine-protein kinase
LTLPRNIGRYEIIDEIGRGSMGVVYRARDPRIGRTVALKCVAFAFPLAPGEESEFLQRFYHEAQIAGRLSHPNIVTIHDVGTREAEGAAFIAMELVTGTNLQELLAGGGRLPFPQVAMVARQAAEALDYAHCCGVVHRDIKPGNLVLAEGGQLKILDFGIARIASADSTKPGRLLGTPNYMAPEQVTASPVDGRADQFSLAVTIYHLLTGERPFTGESLTAISYQVVNITPPSPSRLNRSIPPGVDPALGRAMSKNPADRYPDCVEFAADLGAALTAWKEAAHRDSPTTLVTSVPRPGAIEAGIGWRALPASGLRSLALWGLGLAILGVLAAAPILVRGRERPEQAMATIAGPRAALAAAVGLPETPAQVPARRPQGSLEISLVHRVERGIVYVRIDGIEAARDRLTGDGGKVRWSRSFPVAAGRRRVEIRVAGDDIDAIDGIDLEVPQNGKQTLNVTQSALSRRLKMRPAAGPMEQP